MPKSPNAPHMSSDNKFYKRANFRVITMEEYEVRDAYYKVQHSILEIYDWYFEKLEMTDVAGNARFKFRAFVHNTGKNVENQFKLNLKYDYLVEDFEENTSASKNITLYIPQNLQQESVFPEQQKVSGTSSTKTKNAPAKATYVYLDVKSGSKHISINVFPGGIDNTYTNDAIGDNSYTNYDIKANTHYTEVIKSNGTTYSNYLADKTNDSRLIEKIQHTITSNCYILNPIIDPVGVKSGHE